MTDWITDGESGASVRAKLNTLPRISTTRITSSQLQNLDTAPVLLVAAPGVGLAIVPIAITASYTFLTAPFANIDVPDVYVGPDPNGPNFGMSGQWGTVFGGSVSRHAQTPPNLGFDPLGSIDNKALYLADDQAWTGGGGSVIINIVYSIVPTV